MINEFGATLDFLLQQVATHTHLMDLQDGHSFFPGKFETVQRFIHLQIAIKFFSKECDREVKAAGAMLEKIEVIDHKLALYDYILQIHALHTTFKQDVGKILNYWIDHAKPVPTQQPLSGFTRLLKQTVDLFNHASLTERFNLEILKVKPASPRAKVIKPK